MKTLISLLLLVTLTLTAAERKRALPVFCPECKETLSLVPLRTVTNGTVIAESDVIVKTTLTFKCPVSGHRFTSGHDIYVGSVHTEPPPPVSDMGNHISQPLTARTRRLTLPPLPPSFVWTKGK